MSTTMIANVDKLAALVATRKANDIAKVAEVQAEYDAAFAAVAARRQDAIDYVTEHVAEAVVSGRFEDGKGDSRTGIVVSHNRGRSLYLEILLPEGVTANGESDLPYNPSAHSDIDVATALGTKTPAFHDRTLETLGVNDGKTIEIDTKDFGYYL